MKTIVVHLDAGARCDERIDVAIALAKKHGAHLTGSSATGRADLVVRVSATIPDSIELVQLTSTFLQDRADAAASRFVQRVVDAGSVSHDVRVSRDVPGSALCRLARTADLVVVGQHGTPAAADDGDRDLPQEVLNEAGAPVLIVPREGRFGAIGNRVLIAWKDTPQASRAVRDALPLLRSASQVDVVSVVEDAAAKAEMMISLDRLGAWLSRNGLQPQLHLEPPDEDAGTSALARAATLGADMLVMGAWGHSRFREWVLGGATRHVLARTTVPVLMSH